MWAKAIGTWLAVVALLLCASPAYGDTSAEKALVDYDQLVAQTGRTLAAEASTHALAAEGEAMAARGTVSVLGRVGVIFLSLVTIRREWH